MMNDPTLDELLDEPIVRMLMASDRVSARDVRRLMDEARRRAAWNDPRRAAAPHAGMPARAGMPGPTGGAV